MFIYQGAVIKGVNYMFVYQGTVIKEGTRIPPDSQTGLINSIAWRGDLMVLGDSTGHLSFWDLKARLVWKYVMLSV